MSYGNKPTAWARGSIPQGGQQQINPNLFGMAAGGQPFPAIQGMSLNTGLAGLVNQAAFTNMNMGGMNMNSMLAQAQRQQQMIPPQQQQIQQPRQQPQQQATSPTRSQRTFIGVVTKMMETYGFVDEDVFFQTNVIRGPIPRVGDRVMVEANYNPSMPFKWNAYRIQPIQDNAPQPARQPVQQQQNGNASRWGERMVRDEQPRRRITPARDEPAKRAHSRQHSPPSRRSPARKRESPRRDRDLPFKRDREERSERDRDRGGSSVKGRSPVKRETDSPPRRRQRIIPRYHCSLPKQILPNPDMKYADLRRRYANLYIPSDFIRCDFDWVQSIRLEQPMNFAPHPITFHVLHKDVDIPLGEGRQLPPENPTDADSRFVVKVLLLSHSGLSAIRQKVSGVLPDGSIDESIETQPITKNVQLLVGSKGKGEYMCIGGPWSPSLDGPNPMAPETMVNTAVRTARALTGLDLSACSKWYKMVHLRYYRVERQRVDSVVLMLPDTGAVAGFKIDEETFQSAQQQLRDQLASKLAAIDEESFCPPSQDQAVQEEGNPAENAGVEKQTEPSSLSVGGEQPEAAAVEQSGPQGVEANADAPSAAAPEAMETSQNEQQASAENVAQSQGPFVNRSVKKEPNCKTHWTKLEPVIRGMKVVELREELDCRALDSRGVKNVLLQRLLEAIEKEKAEDIANGYTPEQSANGGQQTGVEQPAENAPNQQVEPVETAPTETTTSTEATKEKQSIVLQIKEEIIELMETDEASEEKKDTAEEKAAAEKAEKERQGLEKAQAKFEKEKKDRKAALERHYALIPNGPPGIFVYPSKTAKSGKFDCKLMSLHSLLDYRPDDSKEASFEVFLFAEALKEALDRSNAFVVYHSVATALEREAEKKRRNEVLAEACKDEEVLVLDEGSAKKDEKAANGGTAGSDKQPKSPTTTVDLRTNFKALVNDLDMFAAFAHFDSNISGYLSDRDLEDIIHSVGLDFSRGEVQRLVKKLSAKDRVNYRDLTDKWVDKEGNLKYTPTPTYESLLQSYEEHAKGHAAQLESLGNSAETIGEQQPQKDVSDSGIVFFNGAMLNVKHCLEQQALMEKERQAVLTMNEQLELQLKTTKEQRDQLEKKKRRLEDDLDRYKKKLHDVEKSLKKEQDDNAATKKALQDCKRYGDRIVGIVESVFPPPKPKESEKAAGVEKAEAIGEIVLVDEASSKKDEGKEEKEKPEEEQQSGATPADAVMAENAGNAAVEQAAAGSEQGQNAVAPTDQNNA